MTRIIGAVLFGWTATAAIAQVPPPPISARAGQTATGTIVAEADGKLQINVAPCSAVPRVVVFRAPYVKDAAGVARCANGNAPMVQASQR